MGNGGIRLAAAEEEELKKLIELIGIIRLFAGNLKYMIKGIDSFFEKE